MEQSDLEFVKQTANDLVNLEEYFEYVKANYPAVKAALEFRGQLTEEQTLKLAIISLCREQLTQTKKAENFLTIAALETS